MVLRKLDLTTDKLEQWIRPSACLSVKYPDIFRGVAAAFERVTGPNPAIVADEAFFKALRDMLNDRFFKRLEVLEIKGQSECWWDNALVLHGITDRNEYFTLTYQGRVVGGVSPYMQTSAFLHDPFNNIMGYASDCGSPAFTGKPVREALGILAEDLKEHNDILFRDYVSSQNRARKAHDIKFDNRLYGHYAAHVQESVFVESSKKRIYAPDVTPEYIRILFQRNISENALSLILEGRQHLRNLPVYFQRPALDAQVLKDLNRRRRETDLVQRDYLNAIYPYHKKLDDVVSGFLSWASNLEQSSSKVWAQALTAIVVEQFVRDQPYLRETPLGTSLENDARALWVAAVEEMGEVQRAQLYRIVIMDELLGDGAGTGGIAKDAVAWYDGRSQTQDTGSYQQFTPGI